MQCGGGGRAVAGGEVGDGVSAVVINESFASSPFATSRALQRFPFDDGVFGGLARVTDKLELVVLVELSFSVFGGILSRHFLLRGRLGCLLQLFGSFGSAIPGLRVTLVTSHLLDELGKLSSAMFGLLCR